VRARASDRLVDLAELLNAPVVTTFQRKDAFPNRHPLFAGMESETESVRRTLSGADVMLAVGCKFAGATQLAPGLRLLHIDVDAGALGRRYPTDVAVQADARLALVDLAQMARDAGELLAANVAQRAAWAADACEAYRLAAGQAIQAGTGGSGNVDWPVVVRALQPAVDQGATVTVDQGAFAFHGVYRHLWFHSPGSLLAPVGGAMGFAFPASLGAQLALPDRRVLCLCGDGGFTMALPDLETAVRYHLPVVTIVANNCAYGLIAGKQRSSYEGRYVGSKLGHCDFAAIAEAIGARGIRVERTPEFKPALDGALASGEPTVIDVVLKPPL